MGILLKMRKALGKYCLIVSMNSGSEDSEQERKYQDFVASSNCSQKNRTFQDALKQNAIGSKHEETQCVFQWWKENRDDFPNLRIVAAALFSVRITPASASACRVDQNRTKNQNACNSLRFSHSVCLKRRNTTRYTCKESSKAS